MRAVHIALAFVLVTVVAFGTSCGTDTDSPAIAASAVVWKGHFGYDSTNPGEIYSLLGAGFLRAPTSDDIDSIIERWNEAHPNARVVIVADYGPVFEDQPDSRFCWVWLVDGEANLNLELVRQGACEAGTMGIPPLGSTQLLVSESDYDRFRKELPEVERLAKQDGLGIWSSSLAADSGTEDSSLQSTAPPTTSWVNASPYEQPALVPAKIGETWGFIDTTGQFVIPPQYEEADDFYDGLAAVRDNGLWGFVDAKGNPVIECRFDEARRFREGLAAVSNGDAWGYIDTSGQYAIPPQFYAAMDFGEGLAPVVLARGGNHGYIDRTGRIAIEPQFEYFAGTFHDGLACVEDGDFCGYIDRTGQYVIEPQFHPGGDFSDGVAIAAILGWSDDSKSTVEQKYGVIDKTGEFVVEPQFDNGFEFSEGLAAVEIDGLWGYIDRTGTLVIPAQFGWACSFHNGLAAVTTGRGDLPVWDGAETTGPRDLVYIDKTGRIVWRESETAVTTSSTVVPGVSGGGQ
jgi:WG containing repeat